MFTVFPSAEAMHTVQEIKQVTAIRSDKIQPVEKASNSLAFSNNLWYNIPGDEKC